MLMRVRPSPLFTLLGSHRTSDRLDGEEPGKNCELSLAQTIIKLKLTKKTALPVVRNGRAQLLLEVVELW